MAAKKTKSPLTIDSFKHEEATRKNIPTAEYQAVLAKAEQAPVRVAMDRRTTATLIIRNWSGAARTRRTTPAS